MATSKLERDKQKLIQDKCQQILADLLKDDDNKYCVDCDAKGPRWASWNLGIFLCIRCAGIHRNLGVHISKVKSVNLDSWTPEQIGSIQSMGNSKARAVYEANLPDNFTRPQTNTALEKFVRAKYELKKYIAKEWVNTPPKPAFDIETELKKEKEKKRSKIKPMASIATSPDIQSNPIPRPNASVNGKTDKIALPSASTTSNDLLGLDLPSTSNVSANDDFGFFASASTSTTSPPSVATTSNTNGDSLETTTTTTSKDGNKLQKEEQDFFNQKVLDPVEKNKLTKESILSLYAQGVAPAPIAPNPINGFLPAQPSLGSLPNQFGSLGSGKAFPASNSQTNVMASTNPFLANNGGGGNTNASSFLFGDLSTLQSQSNSVQQITQNISSLQMNNPAVVSNTPANWFGNANAFGAFSQSPATTTTTTTAAPNAANPFLESNGGGLAMPASNNVSSLSGLSFDSFAASDPGSFLPSTASGATLKNQTANNDLANFW